MTEQSPLEAPEGFLQPITTRAVAKALPLALLWAYVAAVAAAVVVGVVALLTLVVAAAVWVFKRNLSIGGSVGEAVGVAVWIVGPLASGAAVGAAAFASTRRRSLPRTALGTGAAIAVGGSLLALGASGFALAALALGWSVAIPADKAGRIAVRGLPMLFVAVAATASTWGRIADLGVWQLVLVLIVSPLLAAVWVWLADAGWGAVASSLSARRKAENGNPPAGTVVK